MDLSRGDHLAQLRLAGRAPRGRDPRTPGLTKDRARRCLVSGPVGGGGASAPRRRGRVTAETTSSSRPARSERYVDPAVETTFSRDARQSFGSALLHIGEPMAIVTVYNDNSVRQGVQWLPRRLGRFDRGSRVLKAR
jgi:hypothetical protein